MCNNKNLILHFNSFVEQDDPQDIFLSFFSKIVSYYVKSNRSLEFIQKLLEVDIFVTWKNLEKYLKILLLIANSRRKFMTLFYLLL